MGIKMKKLFTSIVILLMISSSSLGQYSAGGGNATGFNSISIGDGSLSSAPNSVSIGPGTITTDRGVALGWNANSSFLRGVSIGESSIAGAVSSTANGANSSAMKVHDVAIGRGAYAPEQSLIDRLKIEDPPITVLGASQNDRDINVYFSNTWANLYPTPPSGVGIGSTAVPSNYGVIIRGRDALDATENPTQGSTRGGQLQLVGGASTGTAEGGRLEFATTPGSNGGENCKNDRCVAGYFDAKKNVDTRFVLLDLRSGDYRRVGVTLVTNCEGQKKDVLCLGEVLTDVEK